MKALIIITVVIYIGTFVKTVHLTCHGCNIMFGSFHHCYGHDMKYLQSYSAIFLFL